MPIDPNIQAFLNSFKIPESWKPDFTVTDFSKADWNQTVERLRASFYRATRSVESDAPVLQSIDNIIVDGAEGPLKARIYTPLAVGVGPRPAILYFHGGGFVLGDLDGHEMVCIRLAHAAKCRVIAIDYRLAPEHRFPAAHDDAMAAYHWLLRRAKEFSIDPDAIAVAGDSAGGNLAAYICQELARRGENEPAFQLLFYPLVQFVDITSKGLSFQEGFFISPGLFDFFKTSYLGSKTDPMDKRVSPLFAPSEDFHGLPPAHVVLCGWDPLNAEGRAYADKLAAAGVPVTTREHAGMVHGFLNLTAVSPPARDAIAEAGAIVGKALGTV